MKNLVFFNKKIEYRYIVAAIYTCVLFLDRLDMTITNIILPTLADHFKVPITSMEWVANGFLLALVMSIPVSSWLGDRFGVKKVFIFATAIFGLSSLLCAFSPNIYALIFFRFIQGLGGGVIVPVGMTMVYSVFRSSEYVSITSFIFIPTLIAPAIAPTLGGAIVHFTSWRWIFMFAPPICFIAIVISMLILKEHKIENPPRLDWGGFLLSSGSLVLILVFISLLGKNGFNFQVASVFLAASLFVYLFLWHEKKTEMPLIDMRYFKNKLFLQANLMQLSFQICHMGSIFLIGMYLQVGVGMSALASGLIMGMQALGAMCTTRYSVRLFHKFGPGLPIVIGFIGMTIFTEAILGIRYPDNLLLGVVILFLRGISTGLCGAPLQTCSVIGFKKDKISGANAIFNAGRQVSISLGVALSSLLISYGFRVNGLSVSPAINEVGRVVFYDAFMMIPFVSLGGILVALNINNKQVMAISVRDREKLQVGEVYE